MRYPAHPTSLGRALLRNSRTANSTAISAPPGLNATPELTETDPRRLRALINDAGKSGYVASWLPSP
jgi:DNA-binding IclR family transcriptional regulator